jgi:tRNA splicing ligase
VVCSSRTDKTLRDVTQDYWRVSEKKVKRKINEMPKEARKQALDAATKH